LEWLESSATMTIEVLGSVFNRVAIHIPGRRRLRLLVSVVMMA
jgi:hypothetical protein